MACGGADPCTVSGGSYLVHTPSGWDGKAALPVLMFFHGYRQSAADFLDDAGMRGLADERGVLLVGPQGAEQTWSFPGAPSRARDDLAFVQTVLDDLVARFPVDRSRIIASGFSQGAAMVWGLACHAGARFVAFLPVAGDFWEPLPSSCPSGPASIWHIHGTSDTTFPMSGRSVGLYYRQGRLEDGWALWQRTDQCSATPERASDLAGMACHFWTPAQCGGGRALTLCLHPGGHDFEAAWLRPALIWAMGLARH